MNLETYAIECVHIGRGHERSIECVDVDKNASFLATGGWDNMLKIWAASKNPYETHFLVLISFIKLLNFILIKYCYKLLKMRLILQHKHNFAKENSQAGNRTPAATVRAWNPNH